jgi:hypothetical protein
MQMKFFNLLILLGLAQLVISDSGFAMTPEECHEQGVQCMCIAHPGSETVCTSVQQVSLSEKEKHLTVTESDSLLRK